MSNQHNGMDNIKFKLLARFSKTTQISNFMKSFQWEGQTLWS